MLERVPASAEHAGHLLLRNLERPSRPLLRSARILDPQFWQHGPRNIETSTWWSSYLQAVRVVPQSPDHRTETATVTRQKHRRDLLKDGGTGRRRRFTHATRIGQEPAWQDEAAFDDLFFPNSRSSSKYPTTPQTDVRTDKDPDRAPTHALDRAHASFLNFIKFGGAAQDSDRDAAWKLFIRFDDQHHYASDMLYFLSSSKTRRHQLRAQEAFRAVDRALRSQRDYDAIIQVELARFHHRDAIALALDGSLQGFNTLPSLLAHLVANTLWSSVAELIQRNNNMQTANADSSIKGLLPLEQLLYGCLALPSLPKITIELAQRLVDQKAVYAHQHPPLASLCRTFMRHCVTDPKIIDRLTPAGIIGLFDAQIHIGNLNLHLLALGTLSKLSTRASKASLALLILRNWMFRYPEQTVPRSILGSLIVMCDEAKLAVFAYDYLTDQWRRCYGKPDSQAYQRILTACARLGDADAVERYLDLYQKDHGSPLSLAFLSPLIYVRALAGNSQGAAEAFRRIHDQFGLVPNRVCWNMLMYAHLRSGDMLKPFDVFEDMLRSDVQPSSYSYGILMAASSAHGDVDSTLSLLSDARERNLQISLPMLGCLVEAHLKNNNVNAARQVVFTLSSSPPSSESSASLTRLWNSLLRHHAFKGDYESVMQTQKRMRHFLIEPDEMTYATLLTTLTVMHKTRDAAKLLRSLRMRSGFAVTVFHYAIILHGYVLEGDRDGATVIYEEIKQRFPDADIGARKSMLKLRLERGEVVPEAQPGRRQDFLTRHGDTMHYLAGLLANASDRDLASKTPSPGSHQTLFSQGLTQQYLETVVASLIGKGSYEEAQQFLASYSKITSTHNPSAPTSSKITMRLETLQMNLALQRGDFDGVQSSWNRLLSRASNDFQSLDALVRKRQRVSQSDYTEPQNFYPYTDALFDEVDAGKQLRTQPVLLTHRHALTEPLSIFIEAMARKGAYAELIQSIQGNFLQAGFRLSNHNFNRLVQVLCLADETDYRVRAFRIAERFFSDDSDFHPWKLLQRGKMILPKHSNKQAGPMRIVKHTQVSRYNPSIRVATYLTWVHLARAFNQAQAKEIAGDRAELQILMSEAGRTIEIIRHLPRLKDRVQAVLLHDFDPRGDMKKKFRTSFTPRDLKDAVGVLGSRNELEHVSPEHYEEVDRLMSGEQRLRARLRKPRDIEQLEGDISIGEKLFGEILRTPQYRDTQGRYETEEEASARIRAQKAKIADKVENLRLQSQETQYLVDDDTGDPVVNTAVLRNEAAELNGELETFATQEDAVSSQPAAVHQSRDLYALDQDLRTQQTTQDPQGNIFGATSIHSDLPSVSPLAVTNPQVTATQSLRTALFRSAANLEIQSRQNMQQQRRQNARNARTKLRNQRTAKKLEKRQLKFGYKYAPPASRFRQYQDHVFRKPAVEGFKSNTSEADVTLDEEQYS